MLAQLRPAAVALLALTLITGVVYPLAVTGVAKALFSSKAAGSFSLLGRSNDDPRYFWGRLSATTPPYNAGASTGSNLGPTNAALIENTKARIKALKDADPGNESPIPVDLVTSSASGLDPHISPEAALYQARRIARLRNIEEARVRDLVLLSVEGPDLGVLGEPRVNVFALNTALDALR